jgi:hypothetical protein
MMKVIPVLAREEGCTLAAVQCQKFQRAFRRGDRDTAAEALESFFEIPRRHFICERGGEKNSKRAAKKLKARLSGPSEDAKALLEMGESSDKSSAHSSDPYESEQSEIGPLTKRQATERSKEMLRPPASTVPSSSSVVSSSVSGGGGVGRKEREFIESVSGYAAIVSSELSEEEKRTTDRANRIIYERQNNAIHRAAKVLVSQSVGDVKPITEDDFIECEKLHPKRKRPIRSMPENDSEVLVDTKELDRLIYRKVANGSQPGPSGMTGEMLRTFMKDDRCKFGITAMVQALVSGWFRDHPRARALLLASRLVLIAKYAPDGVTRRGVRPIAMGESLWKAAVLYAKGKMEINHPSLFDDIQYGVQFPGGCESTIIGIQAALDMDDRNVAVMMDMSNAFNSRERADIATELYARADTKDIWRLFDYAYAQGSSPLMVYGPGGVVKYVQSSDNGVRQGDPLAALLYALSMQRIYERSRDAGSSEFSSDSYESEVSVPRCFAILDDFTIVGKPEQVQKAILHFLEECKRADIKVNLDKCVILCPQGGGPVKEAMEHFASDIGLHVAAERYAATLGSVVGRDEVGMKKWVNNYVKKHHRFFVMVPKMKSQIALLMLRSAGVPRFNYILRTLPPRLTRDSAHEFDADVCNAWNQALGIQSREMDDISVQHRALKVSKGGDGLRPAEKTCERAYSSAVALAAERKLIDPTFVRQRLGIAVAPIRDSGGRKGRKRRKITSESYESEDQSEELGGVSGEFIFSLSDLTLAPKSSTLRKRKAPIGGDACAAPAARSSASSSSSSSSSSVAVSRAVCAVRAVATATVVEDIEECIQRITHSVEREGKSVAAIDELLPRGLGFWSKYNESGFNGNSLASTSCMRSGLSVNRNGTEENSPAMELQSKITEIVEDYEYRLLIRTIPPIRAIRIANCSWDGAPLFNYVMPVEDALSLRDWEVKTIKRHQYGLVPIAGADHPWFCKCGHEVEAGHNHRCNRVSGPATFHKHQEVVKALVDIGKQYCGLQSTENPRVWEDIINNQSEEKYVVPDIIFSGNGVNLAIDVSGFYGEAPTYLPRVAISGMSAAVARRTDAMEAREKSKIRHYAALPELRSVRIGEIGGGFGAMEFLPFVFESHGGLGRCAQDVISKLATIGAEANGIPEPVMRGYIKRRVAIAIQRGNAAVDAVAVMKQRNSIGAMMGSGAVGSNIEAALEHSL